jgi:uncharacterized protein (TIGR00369 family)
LTCRKSRNCTPPVGKPHIAKALANGVANTISTGQTRGDPFDKMHEQEPMEQDKTLPVLDYLIKQINGTLGEDEKTYLQYPTPISQTLGMRIVEIGLGTATVEMDANSNIHGNQQGTVHGGLLCELADAAIGTAHSTTLAEGESFTSIDLKINFFRPVWKSTLRAVAKPIQSGRTISHYLCEVQREDEKVAATVISTVMTLRGTQAVGR